MDLNDLDLQISEEMSDEILYSAIEDELEESTKEPKIKQRKKKNNNKVSKKSSVITRIKSNINIRTVLILLLTLIVNTYAWFIYVSSVSTKIQMHVKSWNFELLDGAANKFDFIVDEIYPGMKNVSTVINAKNKGETKAELTCEIASIEVFDEKYVVDQEYTDENGDTQKYTSSDLFNLLNKYPFKVKIYFNDIEYEGVPLDMGKDDETEIKFEISWDYESGNDELDTEYGMKSYDFMTKNMNVIGNTIVGDSTTGGNSVTNTDASSLDPYVYAVRIIANVKAVEKDPNAESNTDTEVTP